MDVERVTGVVRPRSPWEAVDFGLALARHWHRPLWTAWLVAVAPVWWVVFAGLSWTIGPWLALLALWWLRPLFSRVPLLVLSRALFGEVASARRVLREVPRLWLRSAAGDLTLRRLDFARSFHLPVYQLEGLRGGERRRRLAVLRRDRHGTAAALTLVSALMELCVFLAALALLPALTPEGFGIDWGAHRESLFEGEAAAWFVALFGACAFLAFSMIEPFYVGGGFGLYLDRRTHLEGWDVELAFRRLARRLTGGGRSGGRPGGRAGRRPGGPTGDRAGGRAGAAGMAAALLAAVLGGAVAGIAASGAAEAAVRDRGIASQPAGAAAGDGRDPAEVARRILAGSDFATRDTVDTWELRQDLFAGGGRARRAPLRLPVGALALVLEVLMWALALALLAALTVWVVRQARPWSARRRRREGDPPPAVLFGLDLAPESLPADVPAAARELFAAGRAAEALGLLYRGALAHLARRREVSASWTEEECVRHLAGELEAAGGDWFRRLAAAWQAAAYAHRAPDAERFAGLCAGWSRHLETAG